MYLSGMKYERKHQEKRRSTFPKVVIQELLTTNEVGNSIYENICTHRKCVTRMNIKLLNMSL